MATIIQFDERSLLLRLRDGDYAAFDLLYQRYAPVTLSKLKKLVHLPEIAEELHQDVFLKIWEQHQTLPQDVPFQAVVFRTAKSTAYNFYRKAANDKKLREQLILSTTELYDQLEELINFKDTNEMLLAAVAKLPPQRQKIFTSVKIDGKSYQDVATEFGVSLSTIKDHMAKALRFVRDELAHENPTAFFIIMSSILFK